MTQAHRSRVTGVEFRDDTIQRHDVQAGGFALTWAADDRRLVVLADGADLSKPATRVFHTALVEVAGDPPNLVFTEVPGYPHMPMRLNRESDYASYWGGDALAVDGWVYMFLPTSSVRYLKPDGSFWPDFYMAHSKLIYSPDNGDTWHNQDGSTPVVWDNWDERSAENMAFFDVQPEGAFAEIVFLQMGMNYEDNTDGYVYAYSINGGEDGTANQLVMLRVPKDRVLDREAYEYFAGRLPDGGATWTSDISARTPVHTYPLGWVSQKMPGGVPAGWWNNVVYNAPLDLYLLTASGTGLGVTGEWFGSPSYLGFWTSPTPWGPFTQVHEENPWAPGGQIEARGYAPQIAPQWISPDGRSLWLGWSDYASKDDYGVDADGVYNSDREIVERLRHITDDAELAQAMQESWKKHNLNPTFNIQRIELVLD